MKPAEGQRPVYGVDFSGSKTACNKIWISEGVVEDDILHVYACYPISNAVAGKGRDRNSCLLALRTLIINSRYGVFGMDFPFGLPAQLFSSSDLCPDWESFIIDFPGEYSSADHFRQVMRSLAAGKELKRLTDVQVKAPFCVYNLRLYRQTYFGIREVLHPLVAEDLARILPMQEPVSDKPWLIEICPASTLKKEGLYIPYKGKSSDKLGSRQYILDEMLDRGIRISPQIRATVLANTDGDALDSVIAAFATSKATAKLAVLKKHLSQAYLTEGYTFC